MPDVNSRRMKKCHTGKRTFPTLEAAKTAAAALAHRRREQGNVIAAFLRAYGCSCGGFHFGSTKDIDWSKVK